MTSSMTLIVINMNNIFSFFIILIPYVTPYYSLSSTNLDDPLTCSQGPTEGYHSQFTQVHILKIYFQQINFNIALVAFCIFCQKCCRCLCSTRAFCSVVPWPFVQHPKFNVSHCFFTRTGTSPTWQ